MHVDRWLAGAPADQSPRPAVSADWDRIVAGRPAGRPDKPPVAGNLRLAPGSKACLYVELRTAM